LKYSLLW